MFALGAVVPHGLGILDVNGVGQNARLASCAVGGGRGGHEAREEGVGLVGHDVLDGDAGVVESGLYDGVVLDYLLDWRLVR